MSIASLLLTMQLTHSNRLALAETQLDTNDEIVFLTSEGELQVFDPTRTGGATEVQWRSGSDKGFYDFTLGDVNNDGDMEIIAIGGDATTGRLAVFDPVVTSGINSGTINTIPWRKLVEIKLAGEPKVVAAGDFDTAVAGDEIMVGYIFSSGTTKSRVDIYHGTSANHDGSSWSKHIADKDFPNIWRDASVGDVIPGGTKEIVLIDPPSVLPASIVLMLDLQALVSMCARMPIPMMLRSVNTSVAVRLRLELCARSLRTQPISSEPALSSFPVMLVQGSWMMLTPRTRTIFSPIPLP